MNRNFFVLSLGIGAMLLATYTAQAQTATTCGDHATIVARLASQFGERRMGMGLSGPNSVLEIFASDETGTWSITITSAGGPTCLVAAGQSYQAMDDPLPDTNEGA
tara:strand:+ start:895 stop:1212 length:318 start_codon:yes stop_codon:yes gene_type:complete